MRARYKIGTFVQYVTQREVDESASNGTIEAIVTRAEGHSYMVTGWNAEIKEDCILAAYRQMKPRMAATTKRSSTSKRSSKKAETSNSVHA